MELERTAKENEGRFRIDANSKSLEDDTPASDITDDTSNFDVCRETKTLYGASSIHTESKSPEDKEIEFLDRVHKEQISNEIRGRNREKKLRSQDLSSDNNSSEQSNSLCDIKTVTLETNSKDSIEEEVPEEETVDDILTPELKEVYKKLDQRMRERYHKCKTDEGKILILETTIHERKRGKYEINSVFIAISALSTIAITVTGTYMI
ncbi:hypothetical protein Glove_123g160 [Diversispora epigaea]|uniref:Uncharacterized protein n=1 Tax=Diversispora epigaea TaxID=1348612 RepID=A0A397IYV4_9GLOM|nr:hypothetical protein Glove_123g160 [Diversispora epigaea]